MDRRAAGPTLVAAVLLAGCVTANVLVPSPSSTSASTFGPPAASLPDNGPSFQPSPLSLEPAKARWTEVAASGGGPKGSDLVGFDAGYVVLGSRDPFQEPIASFSEDGRTWAVTSLANLVMNCPGWGPPGDENVPDADVSGIATDGRRVVVVGALQPHDPAGCSGGPVIQPVSWVSDDGLTWQRSAPFGDPGGGRATSVWPVAGGWLTVVDRSAWQSSDGLRWQPIATLPGPGPLHASGGPTIDGARLVAVTVGGEETGETRLFRSGDGRAWTPIDLAAGCEIGATTIIAPGTGGDPRWIVLADGKVCTSVDLVHWDAPGLPITVWRIAATRFGPIAIGDACVGAGNACPDPGSSAFLLTGANDRAPLAHPTAPFERSIADGPAGVLLIGSGPADTGPRVWLLEP